ncbi:MAG: hypothetical protein JJ992_28485, partial [Planctomycetes bacterium]|nr:hypothetical protein [Planctomycetota bacterium]
ETSISVQWLGIPLRLYCSSECLEQAGPIARSEQEKSLIWGSQGGFIVDAGPEKGETEVFRRIYGSSSR